MAYDPFSYMHFIWSEITPGVSDSPSPPPRDRGVLRRLIYIVIKYKKVIKFFFLVFNL